MAYTPQLSYQSSCTLRRIAWGLNIPMTQALERVFDHLPDILEASISEIQRTRLFGSGESRTRGILSIQSQSSRAARKIARTSARYLLAVDALASRFLYLAMRSILSRVTSSNRQFPKN